MNLGDPFRAPQFRPPERPIRLVNMDEVESSPPDDNSPPTCGWLLPIPEDAEPGTKASPCGEEAPFTIRVKDRVSFVEVHVCVIHKAKHDERAAALRQSAKGGRRRVG